METAADLLLWLHEFDLRRAQTVTPFPGGAAVLHSDFPGAHDHNKLSVIAATTAADIEAAAVDILGAAGLTHRLIDVRIQHPPEGLFHELQGLGYARVNNLLMTFTGDAGARPHRVEVQRLALTDRIRAARDSWRGELPDADPEVWRQLGERITTAGQGADATFFGVWGEDGGVAARADLFLYGGVGQVEDVFTRPAARGEGLASAVVLEAVRDAQRAGAGVIVLVADADDWPREWYVRLGFSALCEFSSFERDVAS